MLERKVEKLMAELEKANLEKEKAIQEVVELKGLTRIE